ncbi:MAG: hypothetical protein H6793_00300 [Candidatus Nomurabacteria bacterium]|nr:MAG: hypothetical protein H6793_00300 [Candidatus Nomurabacteria bacterium]
MARTTKVVNKRTTSSKNSNTSKSKGFFGKSFDLKSRKVQFFVVILIVAILGGGYFTLKSFAATSDSLMLIPGDYELVSAHYLTETAPGLKANKTVTELNPGGSIIIDPTYSPGAKKLRDFLDTVSGQQVVICALVRGVDGSYPVRIGAKGFGPDYNLVSKTTPSLPTSDYTKVCSDSITVSPQRKWGSVSITNSDGTGNFINSTARVGYVTIERVITAPAKNSTPSTPPPKK